MPTTIKRWRPGGLKTRTVAKLEGKPAAIKPAVAGRDASRRPARTDARPAIQEADHARCRRPADHARRAV